MSTAGATGPAATEANVAVTTTLTPTELEMEESRRLAARRVARIFGSPTKTDDGAVNDVAFDLSLLPKKTLSEPFNRLAKAINPQLGRLPSDIVGGMMLPRSNNGGQPSRSSRVTEPFAGLASNVTGNSMPTAQQSEQRAGPNGGQAKQGENEACVGAQLQTANDDVAKFMARVVPWPENEQSAGYINVHWTMAGFDSGKPIWTGKPCRSIAEFISVMNWAKSLPTTRDIYFCLSLQSRTRTNKRGKVTVARSQEDALALKALWLDIDVKEPPKGYATIQEAWAALKDLCTAVGLPKPNVAVASGGGLHVYWTSKTPLTPEQWRPLADSLKNAALKHNLRCDAGCTANSAQILRVPGTLNCKKGLRRPVQLLWVGNEYDF